MSQTEIATTDIDPYRLPGSVIPSHYDLHIRPDLESETFAGEVDISLEMTEAVSEIVLNSKEIELAAATLVGENGEIEATSFNYDEKLERVTLHLNAEAASAPFDAATTYDKEFVPKDAYHDVPLLAGKKKGR